jgi:hypothetical protein
VQKTDYWKYLGAVGRITLKYTEMRYESENWMHLAPVAFVI